jgi:bifunctional non-homologous end joining protein LigD
VSRPKSKSAVPGGLDTYRARRDFAKTAEPSGLEARAIAPAPHPRFVIQKHAATRLHYDLRLEIDGVFKSWAVTRGPSLDPAEKRLAVETEDHPLTYGDFEGTIPAGEYGGGAVMIWDRGFWAPETSGHPSASLAEGELKFAIAGSKLQGSWTLVRLKADRAGARADARTNWLLIKHRDRWATPGADAIQALDRSVASGRSLAEIAAGKAAEVTPFVTAGGNIRADERWGRLNTDRAARRRARAPGSGSTAGPPALPKLTHPGRVLWPAEAGLEAPVTKLDYARYLVAVAPWMIGHLAGIPCSLLRAPDGLGGEVFFQRHAVAGRQATRLKTVSVPGGHQPYLLIDDTDALVSCAQISALEFHPWNSVPGVPMQPGRLVFDLDPAPDVPFAATVDAALEFRRRLEHLGLVPFCKTTGGKGLHIVVPLDPAEPLDWPQAKLFAQTLCAAVAADRPDRFVVKMTKKIRTGRIYLDHLRNDLTATAVAPLSARARAGAPVSMPLPWSQVKRSLDPMRFTVLTAPALLARLNPWQGYDASARPLRPAILKLVGGGR